MDRRTDEACNFKRKLGFNLHDVINTKEQAVLKSVTDRRKGKVSRSNKCFRLHN